MLIRRKSNVNWLGVFLHFEFLRIWVECGAFWRTAGVFSALRDAASFCRRTRVRKAESERAAVY